ncbi:aminoglycoside phosphotransferase protein [Diplodia corticola]|uniref:Aminoglycoside phosphotransferase protein n=1 Tax=Diplodia corticola TaxID=236234 RepID=A0A1J9R5H6_9PEZI|nr:aminoglycoside phosphotransferase protein [Diplodia corticola]OJD35856.1 aminoglycoside phosphotransferase protein [Diplodia corticola]
MLRRLARVVHLNKKRELQTPKRPIVGDGHGSDEADPKWGPVLALSDESLANLALDIASNISTIPKSALPDSSSVKVVSKMNGCNNCVFVVEYHEGLRLCIRVPACGWEGKWSDADADSLQVQVRTMQYISRHTKCPIPDIISYDTTFDNAIHAPYVAMAYIEGRSVEELWYDDTGPLPLEDMRQNILRSLAKAVSELRPLTFDKMGSLHFSAEQDDNPTIGPFNVINFGASRNPDFMEYVNKMDKNPLSDSRAWLRGRLKDWMKEETGPSDENPRPRGLIFHEKLGAFRLFSMVLDEFPMAEDPEEKFVLAPPDLDWQNILADANGNVTAILDWDRVETLPRYLGWSMLPEFLFRDWEPNGWYVWPHWAQKTMSPMEYAKYRDDYARFMMDACDGEGDCKYTAKSHIFEQVAFAIGRTDYMDVILQRILLVTLPQVNAKVAVQYIGDHGIAPAERDKLKQEFKKLLAC